MKRALPREIGLAPAGRDDAADRGVYFGQLLGAPAGRPRCHRARPPPVPTGIFSTIINESGVRKNDRTARVGMADHLTFTLGAAGYGAYKYVPYGPEHEVMPYLVRRAQENSSMLSGAGVERSLILSELRRRMFNR